MTLHARAGMHLRQVEKTQLQAMDREAQGGEDRQFQSLGAGSPSPLLFSMKELSVGIYKAQGLVFPEFR